MPESTIAGIVNGLADIKGKYQTTSESNVTETNWQGYLGALTNDARAAITQIKKQYPSADSNTNEHILFMERYFKAIGNPEEGIGTFRTISRDRGKLTGQLTDPTADPTRFYLVCLLFIFCEVALPDQVELLPVLPDPWGNNGKVKKSFEDFLGRKDQYLVCIQAYLTKQCATDTKKFTDLDKTNAQALTNLQQDIATAQAALPQRLQAEHQKIYAGLLQQIAAAMSKPAGEHKEEIKPESPDGQGEVKGEPEARPRIQELQNKGVQDELSIVELQKKIKILQETKLSPSETLDEQYQQYVALKRELPAQRAPDFVETELQAITKEQTTLSSNQQNLTSLLKLAAEQSKNTAAPTTIDFKNIESKLGKTQFESLLQRPVPFLDAQYPKLQNFKDYHGNTKFLKAFYGPSTDHNKAAYFAIHNFIKPLSEALPGIQANIDKRKQILDTMQPLSETEKEISKLSTDLLQAQTEYAVATRVRKLYEQEAELQKDINNFKNLAEAETLQKKHEAFSKRCAEVSQLVATDNLGALFQEDLDTLTKSITETKQGVVLAFSEQLKKKKEAYEVALKALEDKSQEFTSLELCYEFMQDCWAFLGSLEEKPVPSSVTTYFNIPETSLQIDTQIQTALATRFAEIGTAGFKQIWAFETRCRENIKSCKNPSVEDFDNKYILLQENAAIIRGLYASILNPHKKFATGLPCPEESSLKAYLKTLDQLEKDFRAIAARKNLVEPFITKLDDSKSKVWDATLRNEYKKVLQAYQIRGNRAETLPSLPKKLFASTRHPEELKTAVLLNQIIVGLVDYERKPVDVRQLDALIEQIEKENKAYGQAFRQLERQLDSMKKSGEKTKDTTYLNLIEKLKEDLFCFVDAHQTTKPTEDQYNLFKQEFSARIHSQDREVRKHKAQWQKVVASVLTAGVYLGYETIKSIRFYQKTGEFTLFKTKPQEELAELKGLAMQRR